jgi:hypothetical protein
MSPPAPSYPTRVLAGITVPDTPLITQSLAYARTYSDDMTYHHIVRSWLFGTIIAPYMPNASTADREISAVAAILHDLCWDPNGALVTPDKRFEVDSAYAARNFLKTAGVAPEWDARKVQLVWDAIALHTTVSIALHKEPEVVATSVGIAADIGGPERIGGGALTRETYDRVVEVYPLLNLKEGLKEHMCGFCKSKPETTFDNWVGEIGERYVEGYSREGKRSVDFVMAPI